MKLVHDCNRWFRLGNNAYSGKEEWQFGGEYFKRNWQDCEDIY